MMQVSATPHPYLMDQAGTLRTGESFQLLVRDQPSAGRVPPQATLAQLELLPARMQPPNRHAVANGWHSRVDPRHVNPRGSWAGLVIATPFSVYAREGRQRFPGTKEKMPVRFTRVFELNCAGRAQARATVDSLLRRGLQKIGLFRDPGAVPLGVAQARVAMPSGGRWLTAQAQQVGSLTAVARVGTFTPDPDGPFLIHCKMPERGSGKNATGRRLVIQAAGSAVRPLPHLPIVNSYYLDKAKSLVGATSVDDPDPEVHASPGVTVPDGMTIGFTVPHGRTAPGSAIAAAWPHPYVTVTRHPDAVEVGFGTPDAQRAASEGKLNELFGAGMPGRVGNLMLHKAASLTETPNDPSVYFSSGNAQADIAASLQDSDVLTVRACHTGTLEEAIALAQRLGYQEVLVDAGRHAQRPGATPGRVYDTAQNQPSDRFEPKVWTT
jgi:hypothetical protein